MAHLMPNLVQTFVDSDGAPLVGGKVYFYEAGTSTPLATYQDQGEVTPNANPVILDANGQANIWLKNQAYKIVLKDADDNTLITRDNVTHIATGSIETALLDDDAVTTVKILNEAVTTAKIDDEAVTRQKIAPDAVNGTKIEDESIDSEHYVDGSIDREHLAADIVDGSKIADDSIDSEHYVDGSIDTAHLSDSLVTGIKKATNYVRATISRTMANSSTATVTTTDSIGALTCYNRPVLVCLYGGTLAFTFGADSGTGSQRVRILRDPVIYASIVEHFPARIHCVYLRHVYEKNISNVRDLITKIEGYGVPVCHFEHSTEAVAHSLKMGLITEDELKDYVAEV